MLFDLYIDNILVDSITEPEDKKLFDVIIKHKDDETIEDHEKFLSEYRNIKFYDLSHFGKSLFIANSREITEEQIDYMEDMISWWFDSFKNCGIEPYFYDTEDEFESLGYFHRNPRFPDGYYFEVIRPHLLRDFWGSCQ